MSYALDLITRLRLRFWAAPYEIAIAIGTLPATIAFAIDPHLLASTAVDAALRGWWTNYIWLAFVAVGQAGIIYGWIRGESRWFARPGTACLGVALAWYAVFLASERPLRTLLIFGLMGAVGFVMAARSRRVHQ